MTYDEDERPTAEEALSHPGLEQTRHIPSLGLQEHESMVIITSLSNLQSFRADSKLEQAVLAYIAAHLLTNTEKDKIFSLIQALDTKCDGRLSKEELKRDLRN